MTLQTPWCSIEDWAVHHRRWITPPVTSGLFYPSSIIYSIYCRRAASSHLILYVDALCSALRKILNVLLFTPPNCFFREANHKITTTPSSQQHHHHHPHTYLLSCQQQIYTLKSLTATITPYQPSAIDTLCLLPPPSVRCNHVLLHALHLLLRQPDPRRLLPHSGRALSVSSVPRLLDARQW